MPATDASSMPEVEDIAIVGMACLYADAPDLRSYWQNICDKHDAVSDPPEDWGAALYFDPESTANDRIYTKKGGFLGDLARFDALRHGVMPSSIDGGEPDQFLALEIAHRALADADYFRRPVAGDRVEIVLGRGTYINRGFTTVVQHGVVVDRVVEVLQQLHPEHTDEELQAIKRELKLSLPPFNAEMAPALVPNLVTGRIANRLGFQGVNYIVDAACASALIAVERGMDDLRAGRCDMAVVGGVHASTPPPIYQIFCQLGALSRRSEIRPFDRDADGTLLAEGVGILVLKRRRDAESAGDRIYALIKAIGTASDGRGAGILAPRVEGECLALRRAYEQSDVDPRSVGLIEAHGTATTVGDETEIAALKGVFGERGELPPWCALGSVKSMIGHCLPAAGSAGLIKAALALHHKVLPPTLHCEHPNPKLGLEASPFFLNADPRPWIHGARTPRRAGVNAFGFGGINAHAILEEYRPGARTDAALRRPSEVLVVEADSRDELAASASATARTIAGSPGTPLVDHARAANIVLRGRAWRVAVVAADAADAAAKFEKAAGRIADPGARRFRDRSGIYFFAEPLRPSGAVAFLFPGEGSQYPNMLAEHCIHFGEAREWFDRIDRAFVDHPRGLLPSQVIFPAPGHPADAEALWRMDIGPEAVFAANQAIFALLGRLRIEPDAMVGHSTGEYSALFAAGANRYPDESKLLQDIVALNRRYEEIAGSGQLARGRLITVAGVSLDALARLIAERQDVFLAMDNCPHQQVVCALAEEAERWLERRLGEMGAVTSALPFDRAYHTAAFQPFCDRLGAFFEGLDIAVPQVRLYSCMTAEPVPADAAAIRRLAVNQWASRVRFRETIERMYADGVRIFVECGPRNNLTAFVDDILRGRAHLAESADAPGERGVTQLNHLVAQLAAHGVAMDLAALYAAPDRGAAEATAAGQKGARPGHAPIRLKTGLQPIKLQRVPAAPSRTAPPAATAEEGRRVAVAPSAGSDLARAESSAVTRELSRLLASVTAGALLEPDGPSTSVTSAVSWEDDDEKVVEAHLKTMESFLTLHSEVMEAYLEAHAPATAGVEAAHGIAEVVALPGDARAPRARTGDLREVPVLPPGPGRAPRAGGLPMLDRIDRVTPGQALTARASVTMENSIYLEDHTIGRAVSALDPGLAALPVVPLTFSMELMAEAAVALMPDRAVVGMREVRAYRWIALDRGAVELEVAASRRAEDGMDAVNVVVREARADADRPKPALVEGTILLAARRPDPPVVSPEPMRGARPSRWRPEDIYREIMFHGPRLRAIASMDLWAEDGSEGTFVGLPHDRLFRATQAPAFETDAITLDAAGQLIGMWTAEHLERGFHVFPFRMEALEVFGPNLRPGEKAKCRARIELVGAAEVRSNIDVIGADGRLRNRITGWWDKRFDLPDRFFRLRRAPAEALLGRPWAEPLAALRSSDGLSCVVIDDLPFEFLESSGEIWLRCLAGLVLSRSERLEWAGLSGASHRRSEWLLGRAAAKDAVRDLLGRHGGLQLSPADIEISAGANGMPSVAQAWRPEWGPAPHISIAHKGHVALAVAGRGERCAGVGVDIERVTPRPESFLETAFAPSERAIIARTADGSQSEVATRIWCAKEALGKALGRGLPEILGMIVARDYEPGSGRVRAAVARGLGVEEGTLVDVPTACRDEFAIAAVAI